jgi:hypothetical protein
MRVLSHSSLTSLLLEGSQSSEEGPAGHVGHFGLGGRFGRLFNRDALYWRWGCIYKNTPKIKENAMKFKLNLDFSLLLPVKIL